MKILRRRAVLSCGAALAALAVATGAWAQQRAFDIPAQPATRAVPEFARQAGVQIIAPGSDLRGVQTQAIKGQLDARAALARLLEGTGLTIKSDDGAVITIGRPSSGPQLAGAGEGAEAAAVDELIVTAQKKEERIQDVPIAISAFSQENLDEQKIEGGFDLLKAIPNVTFSKNNFSGYNFSIRGIGTKAVSVTTDPGVSVAFNSTPLIRNRLFEQEYYDVERVEVLRGPQGTLYGRNATAGVVNLISEKADAGGFEGSVKVEVGNYDSRRMSGFVNVPLVDDVLAVRLAAAATKRDGYDYNSITGNAINGRDLWSARLSVGFEPNERFRADFIWERFSEDDDRSRTGKQLCHHDAGPESMGSQTNLGPLARASFSQGCKDGSLYDDAAFGTPNGLSIPFVLYASGAVSPYLGNAMFSANPIMPGGFIDYGLQTYLLEQQDPYRGMMQSRDLRTIASAKDPRYQAEADVFELNLEFDLTPSLTLVSQTAYNQDSYYSIQDYNRFNSYPVFRDTNGTVGIVYDSTIGDYIVTPFAEARLSGPLAPGGFYTDPQLGTSNTIVGLDISKAESTQFSQEFRLQSSFDGPVNFSAGLNYVRYETQEDYYVLYNLLTALAQIQNFSSDIYNGVAYFDAFAYGGFPRPLTDPDNHAIYIDPNPLKSMNGEGHNYYRSINPYRLQSTAVFGELYWRVTDALKVTAGLRYTDDRKTFTPRPTSVLLSTAYPYRGLTDRGFATLPDIKQNWGEFTGRLGVDWKPELSFTDQTMLYAFYSRGYKGGGANPPAIGFSTEPDPVFGDPFFQLTSYPATFDPEFVNAFEIGAKNTLLDGTLIFNAGAFYYDYTGYQVSKIVDRTAVNENFDATIWGLEFESTWRPNEAFRMNATLGFQDSELADGSLSLDLMDRTQGNPDYIVNKPYVLVPSNCVIPKAYAEELIRVGRGFGLGDGAYILNCPGALGFVGGIPADQLPNGGNGFLADVSGNELPNTPHWTMSLGAQYTRPLGGGWIGSIRGDVYWQSQSWARVYEDSIDKLHGWSNANVVLTLARPDDDLTFEFYVKNIFDETPITDAFLNSDDSALTTNVFTLDPRLIGLSVRKGF